MDKTFDCLKILACKFVLLCVLILPVGAIAAQTDTNVSRIEPLDFLSANNAFLLTAAPPPPHVIRHPALATPPTAKTESEYDPAEVASSPAAQKHTPGEAIQHPTGASPTPVDASPSPTEPGQSRHYRFH